MITFNGTSYECDRAVRNGEKITLYLDGVIVCEFAGVHDFSLFTGEIEDITPTAADIEISELKQKLADTDYIAAKIAEGAATREEYADKIAEREEWRRRINELEEADGT